MRRIFAFEWEDLPWIPKRLRRYQTQLLERLLGSVYLPLAPIMRQMLTQFQCTRIQDHASGSLGPWPQLVREIAHTSDRPLQFHFHDLFPNPKALNRLPSDFAQFVHYSPNPQPIESIDFDPKSLLTLFSSFHHLPKADANALLAKIAQNRQPALLAECTPRSMWAPLFLIPSTIGVWLLSSFQGPFEAWRFLLTFLIPVVPFLYYWDAVISFFRTWTVEEWQKMANQYSSEQFKWEARAIHNPAGGPQIIYLLGLPQ